ELAEIDRASIGEACLHDTGLIDADSRQLACGEAVLRNSGDTEVVAVLSGLAEVKLHVHRCSACSGRVGGERDGASRRSSQCTSIRIGECLRSADGVTVDVQLSRPGVSSGSLNEV